jgi:hypothetical protein
MFNKYNYYKISKKETFQNDNDLRVFYDSKIPSSLNLRDFKPRGIDLWKKNLINMCNFEMPSGIQSNSDRFEFMLRHSLSESLKNAINSNNFTNLPDSDINFICDCLQNMIVQKNDCLDDIKKNIQTAYDNDNTIINLQDQNNFNKFAIIIYNTITSGLAKYNYICSIVTLNDVDNAIYNFVEMLRFFNSYETIDIKNILNILDFLKHIEIIIASYFCWTHKNIGSVDVQAAKYEAKEDLEKNKNILNFEKKYENIQDMFKNKIFIPYLNSICPNNADCGILYDNWVKLINEKYNNYLNDTFFNNSTFKQRIIKIFNLNYKTISAVHNIYNNLEVLEPHLIIETDKYFKDNMQPKNFFTLDFFKKVMSTIISYFKNLSIELNESAVLPVFVNITRPPLKFFTPTTPSTAPLTNPFTTPPPTAPPTTTPPTAPPTTTPPTAPPTTAPPTTPSLGLINGNSPSTIINGIPDINLIGAGILLLLLILVLRRN